MWLAEKTGFVIVCEIYTSLSSLNRNFANAEGCRSDSLKTVSLLKIGAVFSESEMWASALAKTDTSARELYNWSLDKDDSKTARLSCLV